jgi:hypothetical protein
VTFQELLDSYDIDVAPEGHHHRRQGWEQLDCPSCGAMGHYRLGFHLHYKYFACWVCGSLPLIPTLVTLTGEQWSKCVSLAADLDVDSKRFKTKERGNYQEPKGLTDLGAIHRSFLQLRGFKEIDKLAKLWNLKATMPFGKLSYRIFIPIHLHGEKVSWTTRSVGDFKSYLNAEPDKETVNHKTLLYGEDLVRHSVIVVEGPLDAWAIGPGAVATLGVGFKLEQLKRIARYPSRWICFDAEPKAQEQAKKLCKALSVFPGKTTNIVCDTGKDPSRVTEKELGQLRKLVK